MLAVVARPAAGTLVVPSAVVAVPSAVVVPGDPLLPLGLGDVHDEGPAEELCPVRLLDGLVGGGLVHGDEGKAPALALPEGDVQVGDLAELGKVVLNLLLPGVVGEVADVQLLLACANECAGVDFFWGGWQQKVSLKRQSKGRGNKFHGQKVQYKRRFNQ